MRPINLIPEEERAGSQRPLRTGPIPYLIVGILALAVIGVTLVVVTDSQISERKGEVTRLEAERKSAETEAQALASYTQFHTVREQRVTTMTSLANSRFDWPRVMEELALVLPADVHLNSLNASASTESATGGGGGDMRSSIAGPALELVGCASSQASVGGFVDALKSIDGVTRVGVQSSAIGGSTESGTAVASTCAAGKNIAQFQMTVAFDAAPAQIEGESAESVEAAPAPAPEESTESGSAGGSTESASSGGEQ